ncbi:MAG TPA: hypothetical protein VNX18_13250 [Bryobacteraceae bacterium]|jgi:hypothetical protein|nr:hypothetical protein [Bryobacteraceae bacterium]
MLPLRILLFCSILNAQPAKVPPKRSSQIENGFGINSDLPREPYLPWDRWWWTRMFDAGVSWIRIGQYENSSDYTSWDWVEQKRGVFAVKPEVDDYVDSLVDNGVKVQVQLMYGNPMYTGPGGKKPDSIVPKAGSFHNDDRSIDSVFWAPKTPDEIAAFIRYVKWTVNHFKGRIHYYALWNEQDIGYWNYANPEEYGRLLAAFAPAVHETDPQAKVIYGGQADPTSDFAKRALDECKCAAQLDVFAYHTYPGYGQNMHPESMDSGAYGVESPAKLRALVKNYPGIRKDIEFWDDEFNSIPSWKGSDESVQSKYIPRGILYNHAAGVKTFVWLLTAGVDGNEYDDFGFIHGRRELPDDFTPRPVYYALQNANALFGDTKLDTSIGIEPSDVPPLRRQGRAPFLHYGFRNKNGKAIVAYWVAAHSNPGGAFAPLTVNLKLKNAGIQKPVLIDVVSGEISPLTFKGEMLEGLPLRDSVMAITDASYFDWPVLPEAPSGLKAHGPERGGDTIGTGLEWQLNGGPSVAVAVEARRGRGKWERVATIKRAAKVWGWPETAAGICYRVRAINDAGESAYSNVVCPK